MRAILRSRFFLTVFLAVSVLVYGQVAKPPRAQAAATDIVYVYDELSRLVAVVDPLNGTAKYAYDDVGNILSIVRQSATIISILEFTPNGGQVGAAVTISGTGFSATASQNTVKFGTKTATITSATINKIVAKVPTGATTATISVTSPSGSATSATSFVVTGAVAPTIANVSPLVVNPGGTLTVTGTNFEAAVPTNNRLMLGSTHLPATTATTTSITSVLPNAIGAGKVRIVTPNGTTTFGSDVYVAPPPFLATDVDYKGRAAFGVASHMTIASAGKIGLLLFDGVVGQRVFISVRNGNFPSCSIVNVFKPDLSALVGAGECNSADFDTMVLPETGSYTIVLDPGGSETGVMDFTVYDVPADVSGTITIGGPPVTLTIPSVGQNGSLTFAGTQGQLVAINVTNATYGACGAIVDIKGPSGTTWMSSALCDTRFFDTAPLPETGTYAINWNQPGATTGSVTFQIYAVPADATGTITIGGPPVTLVTPSVGQNGSLTFSGTQGQKVAIDITNATYGCGAIVDFKAPSGTTWISSAMCDVKYFDTAPLPETGTYTIKFDPPSSTTGSVTFQIYAVPPDATGTITIGGPAVTLTTSSVGQNGVLTFSGAQGQHVTLTLWNGTYPPGVYAAILDPDGSVLRETYLSDTTTFSDVPLPTTGQYSIRLDPPGSSTGNMTFQLTLAGSLQPQAPPSGNRAPADPEVAPKPTASPSPVLSGAPSVEPSPSPSPSPTTSGAATPTSMPSGSIEIQGAIAAAEMAPQPPAAPTADGTEGLKGLRPAGDESWSPNTKNPGTWTTGQPASPWETVPLLFAGPGISALSGRVLTLNGGPLAKVTMSVDDMSTTTDSAGRFLLSPLPRGRHQLHIDGRSANTHGRTFGVFEVGVDITEGHTNVLPYTVWMPKLDTAHAVTIPSPTTREVVLTTPKIPGLEVRIPKGTVITDDDGNVVTQVSITPVPLDRPPFPMPENAPFPLYFTLQPGGAYLSHGARVIYPNAGHQPAGTRVDFWQYGAEEGWDRYGQGTVTSDAKQVVPDKGVELYSFTGSSISYFAFILGAAVAAVLDIVSASDGDPVDLGTGLFEFQKTDLQLDDTIPVALTRTYRQSDSRSLAFGVGASHPYQMFLRSNNPYQEADLIFPDSSLIHFVRINGGTDAASAVMEATSTPTAFYKARITANGSGYSIRLRDGTTLVFGKAGSLQAIVDRYGNRVSVIHAGDPAGNIATIRSPNGRWIEFTYDTSNRITVAKDNLGRTLGYQYDASGRLWKVTDANGKVTEYAYNAANQMVSIKDPRLITYLQNDFDANGRVSKQTLANGKFYLFNYTTDGNGKVIQADVTDPRGNVSRSVFNTDGFLTSRTRALGKPEAQTTAYERQPTTQFLLSVTDALARKTSYTYDPMGNVKTVTPLTGTVDETTTVFTYEPAFNQIASVKDPLQRTTTFDYFPSGSLQRIKDPLNHETSFTFNAAGQPLTVKDALLKQSTLGYDNGDLVSMTDPLGRASTRFLDGGARVVTSTDPLANVTRYEYDKLNNSTKATNAFGKSTLFLYDENSNLKTVTDALTHATQYNYNSLDLVDTRTDARLKSETYIYDELGHLTLATDRRGKVTEYRYDPLNRVSFVGFGKTGPSTFESTITYTYDSGNRLKKIVDSANGTIDRDYDSYDRLKLETSPQGSVTYTYDSVGRRKTMTVAGLPIVNYAYDDADRVTQVSKNAAQTVGIGYDNAGQRTSLSMPGSVSANFTFDDAGQITGITYKKGAATLGTVAYGYDSDGRKTVVGGTWGRTGLPVAVSSNTYDVNNRLTKRISTNLTYDDNGNLANDGVSTFTWNARNQLTGLSGPGVTLAYVYDGLGRRIRKTVTATTTDFLYDGANAVQEKQLGVVTATTLTGLGVDEVFLRSDGMVKSLLPDGLGSTVALADAAGVVQTSYTYDPFGKTTVTGLANGNATQFTGREADTGSFYYSRARYYSPTYGRFISEDPLGLGGGDVNLYAYAGNSPTNFSDPYGLFCLLGSHKSGGCIGGGVKKWIKDHAKVIIIAVAIVIVAVATCAEFGACALGMLKLLNAAGATGVVSSLLHAGEAVEAETSAMTENEIGSAVEDVLTDASQGKISSSVQYMNSGGFEQANADFNRLTRGVDVVERGGGLRTATLSNGTRVSVRPFSSAKLPTLEIYTPGTTVIKVRY